MRGRILAGALAALLAGCALRPPDAADVQPRASAPVSLAPGAATSASGTWPAADWWRAYGDDHLNTLIERALRDAPQLASAEARFSSARENVRVTGAATGVQIEASAQFERHRLSDNGLLPVETFLGYNTVNQMDLGLTASYTFDWWGRQHAAIEAALDQAHASEAESRAASLALAAAIAETYFGWQTGAARLALTQDRLAALEQGAHIAARRQGAGLDNADQGTQLQRELASTREFIAQLQAAQQLRIVALAALLGVAGDELPPLTAQQLPTINASLPGNLGLDLIAQRPDIAASRWRIEAARQTLKGVRAEYYPDLSIHALAGLSSIEIGKLLESGSAVPAVGAALHLPIFDAGLRNARHGAAQARIAAAVASYDETVVQAAREVGAAAATLLQAQEQRSQRQQQQDAASALLQMSAARERAGTTDLRPVLEARLALLRERDALLQFQQAALSADIQLKQALGGGATQTGTTP